MLSNSPNSQIYYCHTCKQQCHPSSEEFKCENCHGTFIEEIENIPHRNNFFNNNSGINFNQNFNSQNNLNSGLLNYTRSNRNQRRSSSQQPNSHMRTSPRIISFNLMGNESPNYLNYPFQHVSPTNRNFAEIFGSPLNSGITNNPILNLLLTNSNPLGNFFSRYQPGDRQYENLLNYIMTNDPNHYGTPPASEDKVNNLKREEVTENQMNKYKDKECTVCKDNYKVNETVVYMPCNHNFHNDCLIPWLKIHNSCPVCRYQIKTDDKDYEAKKEQNRSILRRVSENSIESELPEIIQPRSNSSTNVLNSITNEVIPVNESIEVNNSSNSNIRNNARPSLFSRITGNFTNYHIYDNHTDTI